MTAADKARIEEIRAREQAATPGPWERDPFDGPSMQVVARGNEVVAYHSRHERQVDSRIVPNFDFTSHARTDLPWALDLIERQERMIARARSAGLLHGTVCFVCQKAIAHAKECWFGQLMADLDRMERGE